MKAEFKSNGWEDFRQRYSGTYGWFEREDKPPILVRVGHVDVESMVFEDDKGIKYTAHSDKGNVFSFIPVIRGMYKCQGEITYVQRIPARMYKRGVCEDNTSMMSIYTGSMPVTFASILDMVNTSIEYELHKLKGMLTSKQDVDNILLSRQFSIKRNDVYLYDNLIGSITSPNTIMLNSPLFTQEITDIFNANKIDMDVQS